MRHVRFFALAGLLAGGPLHAQQAPVDRAAPVGAAVDSIVPGTAERAAASTVSELLQGRAAGVNVGMESGSTGAAPRLWVRGVNSLVLGHDPLVVVDGIRVASEESALLEGYGALATSRLEDLAPEEVASVRVLRGPAATAAYGPAGANGVLEIRTRAAEAAAAGRPRVHGWSALSLRSDVAEYPDVYVRSGARADGSRLVDCTAGLEVQGACTPDRALPDVTDPMAEADPFRTGLGFAAGARVGGGALGGRLGYGVQAGYEDAEGAHARSGRRHAHLGGSARMALPLGAVATLDAAHARRDLELPFEGNTTHGRIYRELLRVRWPGERPGDEFYRNDESWERTRLGGSLVLPVLPWLAVGARGGRDVADGSATSQLFDEQGTPFGFRTVGDAARRSSEWEGHVTGHGPLVGGASGALTVAAGREKDLTEWENRTVSEGGTGESTSFAFRRDARHASARGVVRVAHLSVGGAVRRDRFEHRERNGDSYSVGAEWALGDERWMPSPGWLDALRLRAAHGRTGRGLEWAPLFALQCGFSPCPASAPLERVEETEAGIDAGVLGALEVGATLYRRETTGVVGRGSPAGLVDAGSLRNRGLELFAAAHGSGYGAGWRVEVRGAWNRNRFDAEGGSVFFAGDGVQHRDGRPAGSLFARPVTPADANGNGVLECGPGGCEFQLADTAEYLGTTVPERVGSAAATLRFRGVRLHALADWQGGVHRWDRGGALLCRARLCAASYDRGDMLQAQAGALAEQTGASFAGFVHDASFLRLREVAVTVPAPARLVGARAADALELTVAGRNLAVRTRWPGMDPETSSTGPGPFAGTDFFAQPLPRTVTMRLDVRF